MDMTACCGLNAPTTVGCHAEEEIIANSSISWGAPLRSLSDCFWIQIYYSKVNFAMLSSKDDHVLLTEHQDWYICLQPCLRRANALLSLMFTFH